MVSWIICDGKLKSVNAPIPVPREGEELVKVDYCGICGTDFQKYLNFRDEFEWGHEIIGRVIAADGMFSRSVGIRTTFPCGSCTQCVQQQFNRCSNWKRSNINGFSEYISVDKRCIVPLECEDIGVEFTLIEPLYVAINLVRRINPEQDNRIAILGNGTIGLLCAYYLHLLGCNDVFVLARSKTNRRVQFASGIGVKTFDYDQIGEILPTAEKIINTAAYITMVDVIRFAQPYAQITFNGISKETVVSLDMIKWHFKNLSISPSFPHPQSDFSEAFSIIRAHGKDLKQIITDIFSIEELPRAYDAMNASEKEHIKVIIKT